MNTHHTQHITSHQLVPTGNPVNIYRTISNTYRNSAEHYRQHTEHLLNPTEHVSVVYRTFMEHPLTIYRKSIDHIYTNHPPHINQPTTTHPRCERQQWPTNTPPLTQHRGCCPMNGWIPRAESGTLTRGSHWGGLGDEFPNL